MKTLTGKSFDVKVDYSMTVKDVMEKIEGKKGIPVDQQRLTFVGKQLEDARMFKDYKIPNKATICMILRLRGGMLHFTSGRQNFALLPSDLQTTIESIFAFQCRDSKQPYHSTIVEIQDSILEAQKLFSTVRNGVNNVSEIYTPHFANSFLPMVDDSNDESDGDDSNNS